MQQIPCTLMRGGTSKGPVFLASDLPLDTEERDQALIALMGSGHELEIDGIGGGRPQSSKAAIVSLSEHPNADLDYLFVQVMVDERRVDTTPNCGNMLCAIGPFAIEKGLITSSDPVTRVRIRNVNTNTFIEADVQTPNGVPTYDGDTSIDGVPGKAAPVALTFLDAAGAKTGKLLPTESITDFIDGIEVTCIDMAMPMVLIPASALGKQGDETPEALESDNTFMQCLERIRIQAGRMMGLGDVSNKVIPKPVLISPAQSGGTVQVRYFMPYQCHRSLAITGSIGISTACIMEGSVVSQFLPTIQSDSEVSIAIEHPSGQIEVTLSKEKESGVVRASVLRTARKLFSGTVYIPEA